MQPSDYTFERISAVGLRTGGGGAGKGVDHATARLAVQAAAGALMQMNKCTDIVMWYDTLRQV